MVCREDHLHLNRVGAKCPHETQVFGSLCSFRHWAHSFAPSSSISNTRSPFYWEIIHESSSRPTNLFPAFLQLRGQLRAWQSMKEWCPVGDTLLPNRDGQSGSKEQASKCRHISSHSPHFPWEVPLSVRSEVRNSGSCRGWHLLNTVVYRADIWGRSRLMGQTGILL